jgi:hypothetical protein
LKIYHLATLHAAKMLGWQELLPALQLGKLIALRWFVAFKGGKLSSIEDFKNISAQIKLEKKMAILTQIKATSAGK